MTKSRIFVQTYDPETTDFLVKHKVDNISEGRKLARQFASEGLNATVVDSKNVVDVFMAEGV